MGMTFGDFTRGYGQIYIYIAIFVGIIITFVGLGLFIYSITMPNLVSVEGKLVSNNTTKCNQKITDPSPIRCSYITRQNNSYYDCPSQNIEYTLPNKNCTIRKLKLPNNPFYNIGEKIDVYYDPKKNLNNNVTLTGQKNKTILKTFGIITLIIGIIIFTINFILRNNKTYQTIEGVSSMFHDASNILYK